MNYSWVILKRFDLYRRTVLQPIKSKTHFFLEKRISVQIGIIIWDNLSITHAWAIDNTIVISYLWFSNFDFDRTWRRLFQKSVGPRTKDFGTLWESRDDGARPIWKESCTSINLICRYRILIQHATSMIWRCLKKLFFPLLFPYLSMQWRIHTHEFCRLVTGSIDIGKAYGLHMPGILIHHLSFSYVNKKRSEEVVFPIFYHPHHGFDWLIDLCLTPTLAVFQLYGGVNMYSTLWQEQVIIYFDSA